jgi:hypothetical protein
MRIAVTRQILRGTHRQRFQGISSAGKIEELLSFLKAAGQFPVFRGKTGGKTGALSAQRPFNPASEPIFMPYGGLR